MNYWEISKRFFFNYYPFLILFNAYGVTVSRLIHPNIPGGWIFTKVLLISPVMMIIWYFFFTLPLYLFKPEKLYIRLFVLIISMLTFVSLMTVTNPHISLLNFGGHLSGLAFIPLFIVFLVKGIYMIWLYWIEERQYITEKRTAEERSKRISIEKQILESHLRLLQAQIEPHFLFNTLANIVNLDEKDPQSAKTMQMNLVQYLKTTLDKTRASVTTIDQEVEVMRAYLDIFKVRMGDRLSYSIDIPEEIKERPFPSMLIQPIVENAIKHGIEPKIDGGEISIHVSISDNLLRWEIADTGLGISDKTDLGIGLSNTIERIESLYGDEGQLLMEENTPSGLRVIIEVPYA